MSSSGFRVSNSFSMHMHILIWYQPVVISIYQDINLESRLQINKVLVCQSTVLLRTYIAIT